jgi:hypothetical protein
MELHAASAGFCAAGLCLAASILARSFAGMKKPSGGVCLGWDLFLAAAIVSHLGIGNLQNAGMIIFSLP